MRSPKLLCVASAVDLDFRYGCTPAWWQLWKGLHDEGADLIVTPYRGRPVETPWWRAAPNPAFLAGESYARASGLLAWLKGDRHLRRAEDRPDDSLADQLTRETIWRLVTPRWRRHLERLIEDERPDAVIVFTVPMAHFRGIPTSLREQFGIPIVFYDGDVPMSLPEFGGMDTGFNYYHGADPGEYDAVISNSEGGSQRLLELGARWLPSRSSGEPTPEFFTPHSVEKQADIFFYGYGDKFRREWMTALVGEPSRALPEVDFLLGGHDFRGDTGAARLLGDVPFPAFPRAISAARVNLCLTRRPHAGLYASSSCRPFELAATGAAIVASPCEGMERWFEPGSELLVVGSAEEAIAAYPPCSMIRGRLPRWGAAPANAFWTSTPTATGRGGCSSSSGSRSAPPSTDGVDRDRTAPFAGALLSRRAVPGDRPLETLTERCRRPEPEQLACPGHVEPPPGLPVWHRGVPDDRAAEARELGDRFASSAIDISTPVPMLIGSDPVATSEASTNASAASST